MTTKAAVRRRMRT